MLPRQILGEILEPRVTEMFGLLNSEIHRIGMDHYIRSGVVLTGGTVLLDGMTEIAEQIFNVPARIGKPTGISGLVDVVNNPMYATAVGLVLHGAKKSGRPQFRIRDKNIFDKVLVRMKKWFKEII